MAQQLTDKQQRILELLEGGMGARQVAEQLDITRNAVYQQIAALKKKGVLDQSYTPTGEIRTPAGAPGNGGDTPAERMVRIATGDAPTPAHMQVIQQLVEMNRELLDMVARLTAERD